MPKISIHLQPPVENVNSRINIHKMGDDFIAWADVFFSKESPYVDCLVEIKWIQENFDPKGKITFKIKLFACCKNAEHIEELNPQQLAGYTNGRIIRKDAGDAKDFFYIRTWDAELNNEL